jgi:hypothetical protein
MRGRRRGERFRQQLMEHGDTAAFDTLCPSEKLSGLRVCEVDQRCSDGLKECLCRVSIRFINPGIEAGREGGELDKLARCSPGFGSFGHQLDPRDYRLQVLAGRFSTTDPRNFDHSMKLARQKFFGGNRSTRAATNGSGDQVRTRLGGEALDELDA